MCPVLMNARGNECFRGSVTRLFQEKFGISEQSAVKESSSDPSRRRPRRIHSKRTIFL